jgi:excisionase family DNA binding protein
MRTDSSRSFENLPEFLSVPQAAEVTNMSIGFWWKQVRQRRILHVKIGSAVRIRKSTFAEWLAAREIAVDSGTTDDHRSLETALGAR